MDEYTEEGSCLKKRSRKDFEVKVQPMLKVEPVIKEEAPLDIELKLPDDLTSLLMKDLKQ